MGVADRARKRMPATGDYLDKDELIRHQDEPFAVQSCIFDTQGSTFGPRWVLSLIPWFDEQEEPKGLLTFTANPTRNPFFEDLQLQIEENGNDPIGPCVVIKGKSTKGFRYYTLDDWKEDRTEQAPETLSPAPAQARPQRPAASETVSKPEVAPEAASPPEKKKPGRPRKTSETPSSTPSSPAKTSPSGLQTSPLPAAREPGPGEAAQAAQVVAPMTAKVVCPDCKQEVTGRALPNEDGKLFVIHSFCPALGKASIIEVGA